MFEPRHYRKLMQQPDLVSFRVCLAETDLYIAAACDLSARALAAVRDARSQIEAEILRDARFLKSLEPLPVRTDAPPVARAMYEAAEQAGVGPMAAVAGAVAQFVGRALAEVSANVIVENGGDIFLQTTVERIVGVHAGQSPLSGRIGLRIPAHNALGICTSSATVGPSLSFGNADAGLIVAHDAAFADAAATTLANLVKTPADVQRAVDRLLELPGVRQALVIIGETMGVGGEFELVPLSPQS